IKIAKDGKLSVEIKGASGEKCMKLADLLGDIVGREESRELTSEYYGPGTEVKINAETKNVRDD
ncbi:MAG: DUF2997 domain-containing protein, partial [Thermodesulfobacteriota bacterium]